MAQRFKDVYEIRRTNARTIAARIGVDELRQRLGCSRQRLHQLIGAHAVRNIGSELARNIERKARFPLNWLDNQHSEDISDFEQLINYAETLQPDRFARLVRLIKIALERPTGDNAVTAQDINDGNNPPLDPAPSETPANAVAGGTARRRKS